MVVMLVVVLTYCVIERATARQARDDLLTWAGIMRVDPLDERWLQSLDTWHEGIMLSQKAS